MTDSAKLRPTAVAPILSRLLVLLGVLGLCFTAWLLLVLMIFSYPSEPRLNEYLPAALTGLPFLLYIVAVLVKWQRATLFSIGLWAHLAWLPLLFNVAQKPEIIGLFGLAAATIFALFVSYALSFPKVGN